MSLAVCHRFFGLETAQATFFKLYGVTPSQAAPTNRGVHGHALWAQVAYNFYILGLPYHRPNPVLHIQDLNQKPCSFGPVAALSSPTMCSRGRTMANL